MQVAIPTEPVRLRVSWSGLVAGRYEGMDDEGHSDEHLLLQVWPQPAAPRTVIRKWASWPR